MLLGFAMDKIVLQNVPAASYKRTMRELFADLIDVTLDEKGRGCLRSLPSNCGYVFFRYDDLNQRALQKHFPAYVSKEKTKEIKQKKKEKPDFVLQNQINDCLFPITKDHPEVLGSGEAEVHLAILVPKLKRSTLADASQALKAYAQKLDKIDKFTGKYLRKKTSKTVKEIETRFAAIDFITQKEATKFGDEYFWDDECGYMELAHRRMACEIQININFNANETLNEIVENINKTVEPIKPEIDQMFRYGKSLWPF